VRASEESERKDRAKETGRRAGGEVTVEHGREQVVVWWKTPAQHYCGRPSRRRTRTSTLPAANVSRECVRWVPEGVCVPCLPQHRAPRPPAKDRKLTRARWQLTQDGEGKFKWGSGDVYEGAWDHEMRPHGKGKYVWHDGESYDGDWDHGLKHGEGMGWLRSARHLVHSTQQGHARTPFASTPAVRSPPPALASP
jgi:hypothetical protein